MPTDKDLLGFAIERASAINGYWNFLIGVSTAVLGIMASGKPFVAGDRLRGLLTAAFVVFAISNLVAIHQLNEQRRALCSLITTPELKTLVHRLQPPPDWELIAFHLLVDVVVVTALWSVKWQTGASG